MKSFFRQTNRRRKDSPTLNCQAVAPYKLRLSLLLLTLGLSACELPGRSLNDLTVVSVHSFTSKTNEHRLGHEVSLWTNRTYLDIEIASKSKPDLYRFTTDMPNPVYVNLSLCPDKAYDEKLALSSYPDIYGSAGHIGGSDRRASIAPTPQETYHIFVDLSDHKNCDYGRCHLYPDILKQPADICFYIMSYAVFYPHFKSNLITIPKSTVTAAFDATHIPHGMQ